MKRRKRFTLEIYREIINACPGIRLKISRRVNLTDAYLCKYLDLLEGIGLIRVEIDDTKRYSHRKRATVYHATPKGQMFARAITEALELFLGKS